MKKAVLNVAVKSLPKTLTVKEFQKAMIHLASLNEVYFYGAFVGFSKEPFSRRGFTTMPQDGITSTEINSALYDQYLFDRDMFCSPKVSGVEAADSIVGKFLSWVD